MTRPNTDIVMIYRKDLLVGGGGRGRRRSLVVLFGSSVGCMVAAGHLLRTGELYIWIKSYLYV